MLTLNRYRLAGASALSLALAACGGGGERVASIAPPPPTPTPTPTPTPAGPFAIFPAVTTSTNFAALGYEGDTNSSGARPRTGSGFSIRYDAASKEYLFDLPASQPGSLEIYQTGDRYWNATLAGQPTGSSPISIDVFRPGPQNWDFQLTYTSFAQYVTDETVGVVAFGQSTPDSAVPVTGSAAYNAYAAATAGAGYPIRGSVLLQFDFGKGTLAGHFDPYIYDLLVGNTPVGHYDFVNTIYGAGSTTFSGELSSSQVTGLGSFEGQFTGPHAEELMARFKAPFIDPYTLKQLDMFGVWVGAK